MIDILWVPLVETHQTGGAFSVIEQWMRKGSGAFVPHVHGTCDEWFYVLDGAMEMTVGGANVAAKAGESVWIPRGVVHSFVVTSDVGHVLNGYTPGGFEQVIKGLASPAARRELPPSDFPKPDERTIERIFNNYWCAPSDAPWAAVPLGAGGTAAGRA
jgi:mannose-6-phosphate isomerase-like protein (cupin superfamily)